MKSIVRFLTSSILVFCTVIPFLFADDAIPVKTIRHSDKILILRTGEIYYNQVVAIATDKGLVIIDTGISPTITTKFRESIEKEFGRNDFRYVINTHFHFDHTNGNQVFPEATIIGHKRTPAGMEKFKNGLADFIAARKQRLELRKQTLKTLDPDSDEAVRIRDLILTSSYMCHDLENNFILTPPSVTFNDRMMLHLGNITLELIYFGEGLHTGDDILIYCPEERALFVGDLFYARTVRLTYQTSFDVPRWIKTLNYVLNEKNPLDQIYDAHNGGLTVTYLKIWHRYLKNLWTDINATKDNCATLQEVRQQLTLERNYPYLVDTGLDSSQIFREHQENVKLFWLNMNNAQSAAQLLEGCILSKGIEAAQENYSQMLPDRDTKYFFDENEFNRLGYRLIGQSKTDEAIVVFKMNVELFPESFNVYDSLGEAYKNAGDKKLAIENYRKSLELNPDNTNAVAMLKQLKQ